jgi:chaperone BCS1
MFSDRYSNSVAYYSNNPSALRRVLVHIDIYNNSLVDKKAEVTQQSLETLVIERGGNSIEWEELGYVDIRATFDTLFFPQKAAYMDMLTRFKEKRMYPAHLPIENKLGIVLHGPPGTGKTRLIASTANFLGYNVNMVDMSKVRTKKAFSNIMSDLHGKKIIIVLEEFDCVSGILRRDIAQEQPAQPPTTATAATTATGLTPEAMALMMLASKGDSKGDDSWQRTLREERDAATDQLDLAYLLTKLDGLESNEGRIIIATTNHPERIDPALLRPGRLGLKVCLSYATREVARDILCMVFQITTEKERASVLKQLTTMDEGSWTPAEILQEAIMRNAMVSMVDFLTTANKQD